MADAIKKADEKNEVQAAAFAMMFEWDLFPNSVEGEDAAGPNP